MFKLDNFCVTLFVSFSYKKLLQCSFYENLKSWCKIDFSAKNSKKFVYYNEELVTNSKFQTQLSRKLQRFRRYRKNKKCSIVHDLSEYLIYSYDCNLLDWSFKQPVFRRKIGFQFIFALKPNFSLNQGHEKSSEFYDLRFHFIEIWAL